MQVGIVGLGLMGGSLGLALRERAGAVVHGCDPDPEARSAALDRGCVDTAAADLAAACDGADLVVVCAPVAQIATAVAEVLDLAPATATVSDIGSTKANVVRSVPAGARARFVGGHPVCGAEARGAEHARAEMFDGATYFLTPVAETDPGRYAQLHALVGRIGARPVAIDPSAHDRLLALTSHLPSVLANVLVAQVASTTVDGFDPLATAGGSFRDMTRVAGANARIWVDILRDNREPIADALRDHRRRIDEFLVALDGDDAGYLARVIAQASQGRRRQLESAYTAPPDDLFVVVTHIADRPGALSGIMQAFGAARINIEDLALTHQSVDRGGVLEITVAGARVAAQAVDLLDAQGYQAAARQVTDTGGDL